MEEEPTQPSTQQIVDPRRLGRACSGLTESDITDVICLLTPTSPAAFRIVELTAERSPQHVLQSHASFGYLPDSQAPTQSLEEAETFILDKPGEAHDLALRFSSRTKQPWLQFCFGRNPTMCDIILQVGPDSAKRVSNSHFRIYLNEYCVLMLEDMSTNGTMVDDTHLKAKSRDPNARKTMMLHEGAMISILSPSAEETIKFIVRTPSRDGFEHIWQSRLQNYMDNVEALIKQREEALAQQRLRDNRTPGAGFAVPATSKRTTPTVRRPGVSAVQTYGMHWNGGRDYNVVDLLGKGAFATVYKLATAMDGQLLAAKELEKKRFIKNGQMDAKLDNEMKIMKDLTHPHIVQYIDCHDVGNYLYIIMEYVPFGNLSEWLNKHELLPESFARRMACQIFSSLAYLHSKKITHRDIKPDNILISCEDPFDVKLSDFGLSKVVSNNDTFLKTFCGTLLYCAPEVFPHYDGHASKKRRKPGEAKKFFHSYSQSVDIWSFGAVLWYALCGQPPFEGVMDNTGRGMFNKIMETELDPTPLQECGISELGIDLLMAMLNTDPASRPTELQCLAHPWLCGLAREIVPDVVQQQNLNAIPEEDEEDEYVDIGTEERFSQLSLSDRKAGYGFPEDDSDEEDDIEPDDFENINPHQSKRIKVRRDHPVPIHQHRDPLEFESSPEISQRSMPKARNGVDAFRIPRSTPRGRAPLFGEIAASSCNKSPQTLDNRANEALAAEDDSFGELEIADKSPKANQSIKRRSKTPAESQTTPRKDPRGNTAAESLYGAESMVRELTMHSPTSPSSPLEATTEPRTPSTPTNIAPRTPSPAEISTSRQNGVPNLPSYSSDEPTPRPTMPTVEKGFNRQISIPKPKSFYWDPYDKTTHNDEYASKVSGIDFTSSEAATPTDLVSMPSTRYPSSNAAEDDLDEYGMGGETDEQNSSDIEESAGGAVHSPPAADSTFRLPAPRLGKLTATKDSSMKLTLRLQNQTESWGRDPGNTIVHRQVHDTLIAKKAFTLWYFTPGIEDAMAQGKDWTKLDGLQVFIDTSSRLGIHINGTKLERPKPDGTYYFGHLYTGDIITVFDAGKGQRLKFKCEFFLGESAKRRPADSPFKALHTIP